ncbi:MAG: lmo0937 family membrane protein [Parcubacteria group bacterium]
MWAIIVTLFFLWILGLITSHTLGGLLHILIIVAIILLVIRMLQGRSVM